MPALAAALVSRLNSLSPPHHDTGRDATSSASSPSDTTTATTTTTTTTTNCSPAAATKPFDAQSVSSDNTASDAAASPSSASLSSSSSSSSSSSPSSLSAVYTSSDLRANEHLAVLLPKHLWKPDSQASRCDIFLCSKHFSIFDRRHHCRKCGGVFCATCTTRTTPLLDVSNLGFHHPPRRVPIAAYSSPTSPVFDARVCDACYDQIHGIRRSSLAASSITSGRKNSAPISVHWETDSASSSASGSPRSPSTPLDGSAIVTPTPTRPALRRAATTGSPRMPTSPLRSRVSTPVHFLEYALPSDLASSTPALATTNAPTNAASTDACNELTSYPLFHPSAVTKATGFGKWTPKPAPQIVGYRVPGCKAQYEIEMEREEEERRRRKRNPVVVTGEIMVRPMCGGAEGEGEDEDEGVVGVGPYTLSTF